MVNRQPRILPEAGSDVAISLADSENGWYLVCLTVIYIDETELGWLIFRQTDLDHEISLVSPNIRSIMRPHRHGERRMSRSLTIKSSNLCGHSQELDVKKIDMQ